VFVVDEKDPGGTAEHDFVDSTPESNKTSRSD
jgi:hypothetical protein